MAHEEQPPHVLAADTNVPLDLALGREIVLDAIAAIRRRIPGRFILVPPTVAGALRQQGLIDEEEVNDSLVLVEAAALDCSMLLTSDEHLRSVDYERLVFELRRFDLNAPVIATPREIVKKFLR